MSRPAITIVTDYAGGHTLDALSATIAKRQKYLNESAFQSVHATAVNALKSLRTSTRVAKPAGIRVDLTERSDLVFSYTYRNAANTGSRAAAKMCLRNRSGVRINDSQLGKLMFVNCHGVRPDAVRVWQFVDDLADRPLTYLIAATSISKARGCAQRIVARRVLRFAGLARRAMSTLMIKTNNKGPADQVSFRVTRVAQRETAVSRNVSADAAGGRFSLDLRDNLRYAVRALKGGHSTVDLALKKAANMTVGRIKQKCARLLVPGELPTPFPDVARRAV